MTRTPAQIMAEALEAIVRYRDLEPRKYHYDADFHALVRTAELGLEAARRAIPAAAARAIPAGAARAMDGRTELEAREAFPPNCPRCAIGLLRCLPCALAAMAVDR